MKQGEEEKEEEEGVEGEEEEKEKLDGEMGIFYNPSKIVNFQLNAIPLNNNL